MRDNTDGERQIVSKKHVDSQRQIASQFFQRTNPPNLLCQRRDNTDDERQILTKKQNVDGGRQIAPAIFSKNNKTPRLA
jgi:hypothetical protein